MSAANEDFSRFDVCRLSSKRGLLHLMIPGEESTLCGKIAGMRTLNQKFGLAECLKCYWKAKKRGTDSQRD